MARDLQALLLSEDPEAEVRAGYTARIAAARPQARTHGPRRVLLAGYNGACNTGADLRTGEIVRHLRADLGTVELGVLAMGPHPLPDWGAVTIERIEGYPPDAVAGLCERYDAVVLCEGSLFTSTFSDSLALLFTAFLGMATALGKPAVAYGCEADAMSPAVAAFVRAHAGGAVLIARNQPSVDRLGALGLEAVLGTDTGWSHSPPPRAHAETVLRALGWDGRAEVLALCPTDPFRWPLLADPARAMLATLTGTPDLDHCQGMMFFQPAAARRTALLDAIATAVRAHAASRPAGVFPIIIGMEANDAQVSTELASRLEVPATLVAGAVEAATLVGVLGAADRVVSARYHAILLAIAAGVPAVGLAYDQRIPALLAEAHRPDLVLDIAAPDLAAVLTERLALLARDGSTVRAAFSALSDRQRTLQAAMRRAVAAHLTHGLA